MISIIVPVYNKAKFLPQCINSILSQDYKDIELILINDGSRDASSKLCKNFANNNNRIIFIDKKNEGVEIARQTGYLRARGEYIMFIDGDDWLDNEHVLTLMYEKAEETGADYVSIGMQRILDKHKWITKKCYYQRYGLIEQPELQNLYRKAFFGANYLLSVNSMCDKLYRKSIIDQANPNPSGFVHYEDFMYNMQLAPYLSKIYVLYEFGYNYRYGGTTCRYNPDIFNDLKQLYHLREKKREEENFILDHNLVGLFRFELKNVLQSEICQLIEFSGKKKEAIISYIESEIKRPLYDKMLEVNRSSLFWKDPFVCAFKERDSQTMYDICYRQVRKEHPKRMLKRFLARILQSI